MSDHPIGIFFELLFQLCWLALRALLNLLTLGRFGRWLDARAEAGQEASRDSQHAFWAACDARDARRSAEWEHQLGRLVGQTGRTTTALRPLGRVEIADQSYDARAVATEIIGPGEAVFVVRADGPTLFVSKLPKDDPLQRVSIRVEGDRVK